VGSSAARAIVALAYVAFARAYDRNDIVLGIDLARRPDARTRETIGLLAQAVPMRLALERGATLAEVLRRVDEIKAQSYPHRRYSLLALSRDLGLMRKGYHGLYDVDVNYVPASYDFAFEACPVELTNLSYGFATAWRVTVENSGSGRDLDVAVDYDQGLIPAELAARLAGSLEILLARGMGDLACPIGALPVMPDEARARVLGFAAGQKIAAPPGETLASLCAAQAERTPRAIALIHGEQQIDYATLHARAAHLAARLTGLGVKPGVVVGIALPRTPALIVAVLAVHKAGGAYLALDPAYPAERIRFIVEDAAAPIIVTDTALAPVFADSGARLVIESEPVQDGDLAYVLYTSGSTGRPKAVGIEHRNLINLIAWGRSIVSDAELRGMLFSTSLNFDLSAFEMFLPLAYGGCIVLVEHMLNLQSAPHRDKVRLINTGPSVIDAVLRTGDLPPAVTTIILAGEKFSRRLAKALFNAVPGVRLLNCYGPTETTVYSSWATLDPAAENEPTIGRAIGNTALYMLDSGGALLPPGAEGELYIGGAGVARGYLGHPELTAARFLPNPFGAGRVYRTGDRVRWTPQGELEFFGRLDDQMKINGIRIEPGEIESALLALPDIDVAAVKLHTDAGRRRLTAYLVPSSQPAPATDEVRAALARLLPQNMVPSDYVWLTAMPMTPNGKLDRKALPPPPSDELEPAHDRPPRTGLEREIAAIWQEVLEKPTAGVATDFFDLGGDSLSLLNLFTAIEARYGRQLAIEDVAGGLTIAGLAQLLAHDEAKPAETDPVVALQPLGRLPPFFCVHGIGGNVLSMRQLASHMGTERPFYGLRHTPDAPLPESIADIAARYVRAILAHQRAGPFYLGGHSFGATVAYEMARQLVQQGHEIGLLAIIDQRKPNWRLTLRSATPVLHRIIAALPGRLRDEFAAVPAGERGRRMRRTVLRWLMLALGRPMGVSSMFDLRDPRQIQWYDACLRALFAYRGQPLAAPVTVFAADKPTLSHLALDETLGWSSLVENEVGVCTIPGNHETILTEPFVAEFAKRLTGELDAAQGVQPAIRIAAE
jgi:amino acid adenylation domain-containing protein